MKLTVACLSPYSASMKHDFFAIRRLLPLASLIAVVALGRAVRYAAIAAVASNYGRRFIVGLRHPGRHSVLLLAIAVGVVIAITVVIVLRERLKSSRAAVKADPS